MTTNGVLGVVTAGVPSVSQVFHEITVWTKYFALFPWVNPGRFNNQGTAAVSECGAALCLC